MIPQRALLEIWNRRTSMTASPSETSPCPVASSGQVVLEHALPTVSVTTISAISTRVPGLAAWIAASRFCSNSARETRTTAPRCASTPRPKPLPGSLSVSLTTTSLSSAVV